MSDMDINTNARITAPVENITSYVFLASRRYLFGASNKLSTDSSGNIIENENVLIASLHVTTKFSNSWEADLSKYPISGASGGTSGSEITDHLTIRNKKYTLEGYISDTQFERHEGELFSQYGNGDTVMAVIEQLDRFFLEKQIFTLFSEYEQIDNCVMTSIKFDQTPEDGMAFSIDFEQLRFAYAQTVVLNVSKSTKKSVASNQNGGGSSKTTATSLDAYRNKVKQNVAINQTINN